MENFTISSFRKSTQSILTPSTMGPTLVSVPLEDAWKPFVVDDDPVTFPIMKFRELFRQSYHDRESPCSFSEHKCKDD